MTPEHLTTLQNRLLDALANAPDETRRLFHGRGRCYPGLEQLTFDWLQGVVLVALFRDPGEAERKVLEQMLMALTESPAWKQSQAQRLLLQHRYLPDAPTEALLGAVPADDRKSTRLNSGHQSASRMRSPT